MFDHPGRIDAHVVGHHVAGQPDAVMVGAVAQVDVGRFAAQVFGDAVVEERIGGRDGVLVAAQQLDGFRGAAAFPDADQPQRIHAAIGERLELFVGDLVEAADVAAIKPAELREPHVGALGDHDGGGHPGGVGRELLVFVRRIAKDGHIGGAGDRGPLLHARFAPPAGCFFGGGAGPGGRRVELHPDGEFFFVQNFAGDLQEAIECVAEQRLPKLAYKVQLFAKRLGTRWRERAAVRAGSWAWRRASESAAGWRSIRAAAALPGDKRFFRQEAFRRTALQMA